MKKVSNILTDYRIEQEGVRVRRVLSKIWLLAIPPLAFLLLDILATTVLLLLAEPGVTPKAALYYHIALLPGTLFVSADGAIFVNMMFGLLIGAILFVGVTWRKGSH